MKLKYLILLYFMFPAATLAADGVGRLFFTPDQRAQLDTLRARRDPRQPITAEAEPVAATPAPAPPQGPDTVTYNGVVRRSDGKSTVWINGKAVDERNRVRGAHEVNVVGMRADGGVAVAIPQASRVASLKVGQRLDVGSGRVEEPYSRRDDVVQPKESAPASLPTATIPAAPTPATAASPAQTLPVKATTTPATPLSASGFGEVGRVKGVAPAERAQKK